jgi:hypothetical protein
MGQLKRDKGKTRRISPFFKTNRRWSGKWQRIRTKVFPNSLLAKQRHHVIRYLDLY